MSRVSVATHIAVALTLITSSLLMIAHSLGLIPDPRAAQVQTREAIAGLVSRCVVDAAGQGKFDRVTAVATELAANNPDVESIGVRLADGRLVASTPGHAKGWDGTNRFISTPSSARIPILKDSEAFAEVEIRFRDLDPTGLMGLVTHPAAPLILFCAALGFAAYRLYMRRVLSYLDPTAVIPERVRLVLDSLVEGVLLLDNKERIVLINRAFARMSGESLESLLGKPASSFSWIDRATNAPPVPVPWLETVEDGAHRAGIRLQLRTRDQRALQLNAACAPITASGGQRRGVILTLADQTETETQRAELEQLLRTLAGSQQEIARQNQELLRLATTDPLTECLNRRALFERAEQCWAMGRRRGAPVACVMIDADHFKTVNDRRGHQAGDQVLRRVAEILRESVRTQDIVGRYGGEEFCLILPDTDAAGALVLAERIRHAIEAADFDGLRITASLGIADNHMSRATVEDVFARADQALYAAKAAGRNRVDTYRRDQGRAAA